MTTGKNELTGMVPVSYCVNQALVELEDYTGAQLERYTQLALRGFERLRLFSLDSTKVAYLFMDDLLNVRLPDDYVKYVKIGYRHNGRIWNLGMNRDILLPRDEDCGMDAKDLFNGNIVDIPDNGYLYTGHYRDGEYIGGMYGLGGGFRDSYYRIDKERWQIVFDSPVPRGEIVLEYVSSGIDEQTLIPRQAIDAVVAWIHWKRNMGKDLRTMMTYKDMFEEEENRLRSFEFSFTYSQYIDTLYGDVHQTLKR